MIVYMEIERLSVEILVFNYIVPCCFYQLTISQYLRLLNVLKVYLRVIISTVQYLESTAEGVLCTR